MRMFAVYGGEVDPARRYFHQRFSRNRKFF
jgi:hypothetical protein